MRILIVDDSRALRAYLRGVLRGGFGCAPVEAESGFEALRLLPRERFDLVIADINMPAINGLELIRFIRHSSHHRDVPILVVSSQDSPRERERCAALGATGFLAKPFEPEALIRAVREAVPNAPPAKGSAP